MRLPGGWLPRTASGITMYACSRTLLENVLHEELLRYPQAQVVQASPVVGLDVRDNHVAGVHTASGPTLSAELVVDVSGTASRLPHWLADQTGQSDAEPWPETVVASPWNYASRWFRIAGGRQPDWQCLTVAPEGNGGCAAMMLRAEEDFWNVVLLGRKGQVMPQNDAEFRAFTAPLADGRLSAALEGARPVTPIHHYGRTTNRWRHVEDLLGWPSGLAALGDSVLTLDPYFGLGMTNAARGAVLLAEHLDAQGSGPFDGPAYQQDLARLNAAPWRLVTGRNTDGTPVHRKSAQLAQLYAAAPSSPDIARAILEVQHLLRSEDSLMKGVAA